MAAARNVSTEDAPLDAADRNWYPEPSEPEVVVVADAPLAANPRDALSGAAFAVEPSPGLRDDDDDDDEEEDVGLET